MRILLVDDEALARARLASLVEELGGHEVVGEAADATTARALIGRCAVDVVLLDVRMPGEDGLALAASLVAADGRRPVVVFVTAFEEHAVGAFERDAADYLLKPVRRERLALALERASRRLALPAQEAAAGFGGRSHLVAVSRGGMRRVPIEAVRVLQAGQKYVSVLWPEGELLIEDSLKALEAEYGARFLRVHRNALVARAHVEGLERDLLGNCFVRLAGIAARVPVSRRLLAEVRRALDVD